MLFFAICLFFAIPNFAFAASLVTTNLGRIQGSTQSAENGRIFHAFKKVPYAQPPIGNLRFSPPEKVQPWSGVLDATKDSPVCLQRDFFGKSTNVIGSEDCLYMNIYTPKLPSENESYPYPVIIWIHGGSWLWWSGSARHFAPNRFMNKDIVLVTINYRLGWFGFLSTEDEVVRGNNGLKDQTEAIKWVKEHISVFGGDPERVTLAGQGAGGTSAHLHMLSPLSKSSISGVILQSGNAFIPMAVHYPGEALKKTKILAEAINCPMGSNAEIVECLRHMDAKNLIPPENLLHVWEGQPVMPLRAVVEEVQDGAFLVEHPDCTVQKRNQTRVPIMLGFNRNDGVFHTSSWISSSSIWQSLNENYSTAFPAIFGYDENCTVEMKNNVSDILKATYFQNQTTSILTHYSSLEEAVTSRLFRNPVNRLIERQHGYNTIFVYQMNYRSSLSFSQILGAGPLNLGVCHCDELQYLFNMDKFFITSHYSVQDFFMTETISELWYNFAATGNPTPETTNLLPTKWEKISGNVTEIFNINGPRNMSMGPIDSRYIVEEEFWDGLSIESNRDCQSINDRSGGTGWKNSLKNYFEGLANKIRNFFG